MNVLRKILLVVAAASLAPLAQAGTVTVTWTPPTTCNDGSALVNCATTGFKIYGALSAQTKVLLASPVASATVQVFNTVTAGNWCYDMTTLAGAQESAHSAQACKVVAAPAPNPPTIVTIDAVAYQITKDATGVLVAKRIGVSIKGVSCLPNSQTVGGVKYNQLDTTLVDLTEIPAGVMQGYSVWAHCKAT